MNFREMTKEQLQEESLIDLAHAILEDGKAALPLADLLKEIQNLNGMTDEEIRSRLVQFYTDLNIEGRFLLNQESGWGLREWYKVETIEEETAPTVKARKKKKVVLGDDELFEELDEEDLEFEDEIDEFIEEEDEEEDVVLPGFDVAVEDEEDVELVDFVEDDIDEIDEEIDEELIDEEDDFAEDDLEDDLDDSEVK